MLTFQRIIPTSDWWVRGKEYSDHTVSHTKEWMSYIAETHPDAVPVFADICDGSVCVGRFFGLVFQRFGIRILGSPFPGWTTTYMGFNLDPIVPRWLALQGLERFAFYELGCLHFEIADRLLTAADAIHCRLFPLIYHTYETDLTKSEQEIYAGMTSPCRRCIRKAEKSGVVIEESTGDDGFVEEYYEQLKDVFLKQGLVPTYSLRTARKFIHHLWPTGNLLLLRARDPNGSCIASGIYPGLNRYSEMWGNASFRTGQHLRPNQALHWYAMRYWKGRGAEFFDWGGEGLYKEKYGCHRVVISRFCKSRIPILPLLRSEAQKMFYRKRRVLSWCVLHYEKIVPSHSVSA
jgi:hypothetical protein